jgi:hypothetical protein
MTYRTREEFALRCSESCRHALQRNNGRWCDLNVKSYSGHGMSPGEIRACYHLYAAHRKSHRSAVVGHLGHLRKMLASLAAQLFGRGALAAR